MREKRSVGCCRGCGSEMFTLSYGGRGRVKEWCSDKCRAKGNAYPTSLAPLCSGTTGAVGELAVAGQLMREGWHVYRCLSPNGPFDLIAFRDGVTRRLEVRTGKYTSGGSITFPNDRDVYVTEFGVWLPEHGCVEFIPCKRETIPPAETSQSEQDRETAAEIKAGRDARLEADPTEEEIADFARREVIVKFQVAHIMELKAQVQRLEKRLIEAKIKKKPASARSSLSEKHKKLIAERKKKGAGPFQP